MKVQVNFDGGMGEFPIKGYHITEESGKSIIHIDPQVICNEKIVIIIPNIKLLNTDNCINITIRGNYPTIIVNIHVMEEYQDSYYTFCGYNSGSIGFYNGFFVDEYTCVLHVEEHTENLPF